MKEHKIDEKAFKLWLETMQPRQKLFEMMKTELERRGHWKLKPRGKNIKYIRNVI